ncbi:MAG: hypothetical protein WCD66_02590 [Rhodanobacteraceae bacterium]
MSEPISRMLLLVTLATLSCAASATQPENDTTAIRQVTEKFQKAVVTRDRATLENLFLPGHTSWIAVLDTASYRAMQAAHPRAPRVKPGSPAQFIDAVVSYPGHMQEKFSNMHIRSNGAVASVYFDFDFLQDGRINNHGSETWQLVNTASGWKINALIYSVNLDASHSR